MEWNCTWSSETSFTSSVDYNLLFSFISYRWSVDVDDDGNEGKNNLLKFFTPSRCKWNCFYLLDFWLKQSNETFMLFFLSSRNAKNNNSALISSWNVDKHASFVKFKHTRWGCLNIVINSFSNFVSTRITISRCCCKIFVLRWKFSNVNVYRVKNWFSFFPSLFIFANFSDQL